MGYHRIGSRQIGPRTVGPWGPTVCLKKRTVGPLGGVGGEGDAVKKVLSDLSKGRQLAS